MGRTEINYRGEEGNDLLIVATSGVYYLLFEGAMRSEEKVRWSLDRGLANDLGSGERDNYSVATRLWAKISHYWENLIGRGGETRGRLRGL